MKLITLTVGPLATNCYILKCTRTGSGFVIDPGADEQRILAACTANDVSVNLIVLTHAHFDHTGAAAALRAATGVPIAIHRDEADLLARPNALFPFMRRPDPIQADRLLDDGEQLQAGDLAAQVIATPGHSPGGISLHVEAASSLFAGDALFREGVGRTDFPGSSAAALSASIRTRLYCLPDDTVVYPGHGPQTTIGWEKAHNPFVRPLG